MVAKTAKYSEFFYTNTKIIPHTGDKASLDRYG